MIYVCEYGTNNRVHCIPANGYAPILPTTTIESPNLTSPRQIGYHPLLNRLVVWNNSTSNIVVINPETNTVSYTIFVGSGNLGSTDNRILYHPDWNFMCCVNNTSTKLFLHHLPN
jgi:DNA-binding beta-propeller fold protein YncE